MTEPSNARWSAVGVITFVVASVTALFLFSLGLVVNESVIWPTATLATSIIAALVASLSTQWLIRPRMAVDVSAVAAGSLVWALFPAALILLFPLLVGSLRLIWWIVIVVIYSTAIALRMASRNRSDVHRTRPFRAAAFWLLGTVAGVVVIIFVASLFGLTGA